jgi:ATP-dependent exoDNAse (exonuclease V) alpha subunit
VLTSHASQGKTVDRVLLAESEQSLPAASREQFYVSASRARESVTVYTDDKRELRRAIEDSSQRLSARELEQKPARESKGLLQRHAERLQRVAELARAYASQKVADVAGRYARMRGREQERER